MHGEPSGIPSADAKRTQKRRLLIALGLSCMVLASVVTLGVYLNQAPGPETFVEVYVTDLPAPFSRLDLRIARVEVGAKGVPLELDNDRFDLLQLQGPGDALRIARGYAPAAKEQEIRIIFADANVELDHKRIPVEIPDAVLSLGHEYGLEQQKPRSILFDIDVNQSLFIDGPSIRFEPHVASVYVLAQGAVDASKGDGAASTRVDFTNVQPEPPKRQTLTESPSPSRSSNPFATVTKTVTSSVTATTRASTTSTSPATTSGTQPSGGGGGDGGDGEMLLPDPGEGNAAQDYPQEIAGWFIQYLPNETEPQAIEDQIMATGAEFIYRFQSLPAYYVAGHEIHLYGILNQTWVDYVEPAANVTFHLASTKMAIRSLQVTDPVTGLRDAQGRPIDGRGVGVAVVDTGIDGLHPDLTHFLISGDAAPVRANFKVASNSLIDMAYTDTTSGHGTHVAGIVAGRGTKDDSMSGVAPGAKLYGFAIGELSNTFWPNQAFDWIIQHGHKQNPPIKVVTNSWGTTGAHDPNSLTSRLVNQMVGKGMTVVFSAGNAGGDGFSDTTSAECKNPTPGVICVSWYDDIGGSINGKVAGKASRGLQSDASTWPDISAPGTSVRSARTPFGWVTGVGLTDYYVTLSGSSMSAPHVAGAAALMLQAKPGLSPAQIESLLTGNAYKYADLGDYVNGSHYAKGHGLLHTYAAVQAAKNS